MTTNTPDDSSHGHRQQVVVRHPLAVRLTHWIIAGSGIALLFSGFGELPMYKRYNLVKLPGMAWASDFELNLVIHYVASILFVAAAMFHLVYHWRRRELAALPRKGDMRESVDIIKAMVRGKAEPPHGKFLAEQRLAYAAMAGTAALLILTGLVKVYKNMGDITLAPAVLQGVTLAHIVGGMLFMVLLLAHLGAFALRANWPLLPSMFSGKVSRRYARERHPLWDIDGAGAGKRLPAPPLSRTKDILRLAPGVLVLTGATLAATASPWWLLLIGFVGLNLLQSAFTRWCLLESMLLRAGVTCECFDGRQEPGTTTREILRLAPGLMLLASVGLSAAISPWWLLLTAFVGLNLLQSAFTRWCLLESLLLRAGVPDPCGAVPDLEENHG